MLAHQSAPLPRLHTHLPAPWAGKLATRLDAIRARQFLWTRRRADNKCIIVSVLVLVSVMVLVLVSVLVGISILVSVIVGISIGICNRWY